MPGVNWKLLAVPWLQAKSGAATKATAMTITTIGSLAGGGQFKRAVKYQRPEDRVSAEASILAIFELRTCITRALT